MVLNCCFLSWGPSFYVCNAKLILMVKVYVNSFILNINMLWTLICYESESDSTVKDCFRNWNNGSVKWPDFESKYYEAILHKIAETPFKYMISHNVFKVPVKRYSFWHARELCVNTGAGNKILFGRGTKLIVESRKSS